ncbi:MAG TPA: ribosome small subunit-dependent GTPase A [Symbiobacteriaceae bacterium]|nr:ribosome small subunit-dependent GTPase A [Symbiobacteriaceae bacterium]
MQLSGMIVRNDGPRMWAQIGTEEVPCVLRGRLKREAQRVTSLVVVGDEVEITRQPDGTGVIEAIRPRRSELSRQGFHGYVHVIAANVDQLLFVGSAQQPRFKLHLAERFLAIARRGRMEAVVVISKCDLEHENTLRAWVAPLQQAGVRVIFTSIMTGLGVAELRAVLTDKVSVLAGQSGVGKSSLVNALYPEAGVRTNTVSEVTSKGRHTTTASRLYALPGGGYLVDTPGIKSLELMEEDTEDDVVEDLYPEVTEAASGCKFRDCTHTHEPHCAVKQAVARGQIRQDRYRNFLRMQGA